MSADFDLYGDDPNFANSDELYGSNFEDSKQDGNRIQMLGDGPKEEELVDFEVDAISPIEKTQQAPDTDTKENSFTSNPSTRAGNQQASGPGSSQRTSSSGPSHALPPNPLNTGPRALYVNELSWWTTDEELRLIAGDAGVGDQLGARDIIFYEHKINGKSRGLVYMEFRTHSAAKTFKELLDKMEIHGKRPVTMLVEVVERGNLFKHLPARLVTQGTGPGHNPGMSGQAASSGGGPTRHGGFGLHQHRNRSAPYSRPNQGNMMPGFGQGVGTGPMGNAPRGNIMPPGGGAMNVGGRPMMGMGSNQMQNFGRQMGFGSQGNLPNMGGMGNMGMGGMGMGGGNMMVMGAGGMPMAGMNPNMGPMQMQGNDFFGDQPSHGMFDGGGGGGGGYGGRRPHRQQQNYF
ncbi:hypothetical protein HDU96_002274 [Phlyctochytrium bullatum]|nr:hypothetical protein HDU96_002274 [Phlyctochytrium bullatum]